MNDPCCVPCQRIFDQHRVELIWLRHQIATLRADFYRANAALAAAHTELAMRSPEVYGPTPLK